MIVSPSTFRLLADGAPPTDGIYNFFMIMMGFVVLMLILTAVYVIRRIFDRQAGEIGGWELRGAGGRVFAVARNAIAEGIRTKIASGFAVMILLAIPTFWFTASGDGTIKGQVQMFIAYSLGFTSFMLALLTIFFSCRSLSIEVASRQIYGVVCKPIPRWQIIAGKLTGVILLNVILLIPATVMTYAGTLLTLNRFEKVLYAELQTYGHLTPEQAATAVEAMKRVKGVGGKGLESPVIGLMAEALGKTDEQIAEILIALPEPTRVNMRKLDELRRQVLVCRANVSPQPIDNTEAVRKEYERMEKSGTLPTGLTKREIWENLEKIAEESNRTVAPGTDREWTMKGPPPKNDDDFLLTVRFKIRVSQYLSEVPEAGLEESMLRAAWAFGNPQASEYHVIANAYPVDQFTEFDIPRKAVGEDGTVVVRFANVDPRQSAAVFEAPWGLQIMYRIGPFSLSLIMAAVAILIPLVCLAAFGVCASTFLSFPVASLIVVTLYILTSSMGFVAESLATTKDYYDPTLDMPLDIKIRATVVEAIGWVLAIGDTDPITHIVNGQGVGWAALWNATWKFVLIKSTVVGVLAVFIFRRRELAAVIV